VVTLLQSINSHTYFPYVVSVLIVAVLQLFPQPEHCAPLTAPLELPVTVLNFALDQPNMAAVVNWSHRVKLETTNSTIQQL
jgi:hypothetical protein